MKDGLPARMVYHITQDQDGFIWLSTQLGIHRYDGHEFQNYPNPSIGLPSRIPARLAVDGENRLWISCVVPLESRSKTTVLDIRENRFMSVSEATEGKLTDDQVMRIASCHRSESGVMIVRPNGELIRYNGEIEHYGTLTPGLGGRLESGKKDVFWYWGEGGVQEIRKGTSAVFHSLAAFNEEDPELKIIMDGQPIIWLGQPKQYWNYTISASRVTPFTFPGTAPKEMRQPIAQEKDYFIYAGYDRFIVRDAAGELITESPAFTNHTFSDENRVFEVFKDRQANIWVGTVDGMYKISAQPNFFSIFHEGFSTHGILPDGDRLWVTHKENFVYLDRQTQDIRTVANNFNLNSFYKAANGIIWGLAEYGVLLRYDQKTETLNIDSVANIISSLTAVESDDGNAMWLGTTKGVFRVNKMGGIEDSIQLELLAGQNETNAMQVRALVLRGAELWAAGTRGVEIFEVETGRLTRQIGPEQGLPFTDLNHLHIDDSGIVWLASRGGGLIRWDPQTEDVQQFTIANGLSNDNIYAVLEDQNGFLWLSSDYGLMSFDKESQDVRVFHLENGLLHEEFNTLSYAKDSAGYFYFGGIRGLIRFHPVQLTQGVPEPFTGLLATKISVLEAGAGSYEDQTADFAKTKQLEFHPHDQLLEIQVSNLDFTGIRTKELAYRLKGYHTNWIYLNGSVISLMNPPYGQYELEVKARSSTGGWLPPSLSIPLHVIRPFYYRPLFWVPALFVLFLIIWGIFQLRIRTLKRSRKRMEAEVKKRTRTIADQKEEIEQLSEAKSRFFANITHELRTPLTLIIGPLKQIVRAPLKKDAPIRLEGILRNSENLLNLINQLLDVSKLENAKMEVETKFGDIAYLTETLLKPFSEVAGNDGIALNYLASPANIEVEFDQDKWEKILNNLLSNALKFTPPGGKIDVGLALEEMEGKHQVKLTVTDTGTGIAGPDHASIFERFYQPKDSSRERKGGTGIGLALTKELVELQGGTIAVRSALGEGSSFTVIIPATLPATMIAEGPKVERQDKIQLLLIEDNEELRSFIASCFALDQYEIQEARNGEEGVRFAQEQVPDIIVSDVMMPKMNGFEVAKALRGHVATSHIPIVFLTAKSSLESRLEGLRHGADAYLTKPFSPEELRLRVEKLLEMRDLYKKRFRYTKAIFQDEEQEPGSDIEPDPAEQFMSDLKSFISSNLSNPQLKVPLITQHFGISRAQFYRKLQAITDLGVSELIRAARCEASLRLICQNQFTMAEIAYEVGFSSPSQFSKSFKAHFGKTPKEFQREMSSISEPSNS